MVAPVPPVTPISLTAPISLTTTVSAVVPVLVAVGLGALAGVFTPWLVHRWSTGPGSPPRTVCPDTGRPFPTGPSGWLSPGARCPDCARRHGPRTAPVVAAAVVALGLLAAARTADPVLPALLAVAVPAVPLAAVDLAALRLPDPLVGAAGLTAVAGLTGTALVTGDGLPLLAALAGGTGHAAAYVVLALLPGSRLGFGDVKLAGVLGLPLGWLGWDAFLLGLLLPHVVNGVVAVFLLATGRAVRRTALPLGPALLVGALLAAVLA